MNTEAIAAKTPKAMKKPIAALCYGNDDSASIYSAYLEFILYWTKTDVESYRNAVMAARGSEVKGLLLCMADKKEKMLGTFRAYRAVGQNVWFESAFGNVTRSSADGYLLDNGFRTIQSLNDAFHFAYRKEYRSLNTFEKVRRSDALAPVQTLLESAAEHLREHILNLDSWLSSVRQVAEPIHDDTDAERSGERWALVLR